MNHVLKVAETSNPDVWTGTGGYYPRVRVDELFELTVMESWR